MPEQEIKIDTSGIRVAGYRDVTWDKDKSVHRVCDLYSAAFGACEVYLPTGTQVLTGLKLGVLVDKGGRRRLTVRAS